MKSVHRELERRVIDAIAAIGAEGLPLVMPSNDDRHGDYQSNCAMGLAKKRGEKPRDVAARIIDALDVADMCEAPTIAGPGFINFTLTPEYLGRALADIPAASAAGGDRLGIAPASPTQTIAVDLSSPNLAKEMHVGHLRSTVIGDAVSRILEFRGHDVIRENHVGDWGTQFGMLVTYLRHAHPEVLENPDELIIADLESFYVAAKKRFDDDEAFKLESQQTVVELQQGDAATRKTWLAFCNESLRHCHAIYKRLDVELIDRGESFYNDLMPVAIKRLEEAGLAVESDGALVVYLDGYETRDGDPLPLIIRKRDGGYNYASSDLATILHRTEELNVDGMVYVVGAPQKQHFEMVFATIKKAGWAPDVWMEHLGFGSMLAASGKPFKTREGGTFKLKDLLDQAVDKARAVLGANEGRGFSDEEIDDVAEAVGIAAIKYFDLSHSLAKDYKFDLDTMLALDGNTAPYMMYAYARVRSIGRKAGVDFDQLPAEIEEGPIVIEHPAEAALAKKILRFADVIDMVSRDLRPNVLTDYLYDLSRTFSRFYDRKLGVRVIDAESETAKRSRLRLAELTARTLRIGLQLLGIRTVDKM